MHATFRNVNDGFFSVVKGIHEGGIAVSPEKTRGGEVLKIVEPSIFTFEKPLERVLFNESRNVNPFMILYEGLWMLSGRKDLAPLLYYNKRMLEYSDDGLTLNGAYGHRWFQENQLGKLISHLKSNPQSRRAVLSMWNIQDDLLKIDESKDICCNTQVFLCVRESSLDLTVINRSNDLLWGTFGNDHVHFSLLQEYLAGKIGLSVGRLHVFSNNFHVYLNRWNPQLWLAQGLPPTSYPTTIPLWDNCSEGYWGSFDQEMWELVSRHDRDAMGGAYHFPFLYRVAQPMFIAHHYYKRGDFSSALLTATAIKAEDWRIRCTKWLERRQHARSTGEAQGVPPQAPFPG
jgi:thymidylate synthase